MSIEQTLRSAIAAHKSGRLHEAAALYHVVLSDAPEHTSAMQGLASAEMAQKHWAAAIETLTRLSQVDPKNPIIWHTLSMAAAQHRSYPLAIEAYERYIALTAPSAQNMLAFADLLLMAHELDRSIKALDEARSLGSDNAETHYMAARQKMLEGDAEGAKRASAQALERQSDHPPSWQLLAEISSADDIETWKDQLQAAEASSDDATIKSRLNYALGKAHQNLKDPAHAFQAFTKANQLQNERLSQAGQAYDTNRTTAEIDGLISLFPKAPSASKNSTAHRPIFILGMPRTGTTLVERILSSLEGVSAGGENEAMEFIAAQYYHDINRGAAPTPMQASADVWAKLADDYWQRTPASSPIVTDKMPHNFRHIGLILGLFPDAPILFMRREPRDVALSIFTRIFPDGHSYACDLKSLAHYYKEHERLRAHWHKIAPDRILDVDYHELVTAPEAASKTIAAHCRLNWSEACLDFHKDTRASYTFSELQVRQPVNTKGLERWRQYETHLTPFIDELET